MTGQAELVESWRQGVLELVQDLAVVEGALVDLNGDQVPKTDSLRWIERVRARLQLLAERMTTQQPEKGDPE